MPGFSGIHGNTGEKHTNGLIQQVFISSKAGESDSVRMRMIPTIKVNFLSLCRTLRPVACVLPQAFPYEIRLFVFAQLPKKCKKTLLKKA